MTTTVRIENDPAGLPVIWSEVGGKKVPLPVEHIYIHALTGHIRTASPGPFSRGECMQPLRPHEVEMVEFWLRERGEIVPVVFSGEPTNTTLSSGPMTPDAKEKETH